MSPYVDREKQKAYMRDYARRQRELLETLKQKHPEWKSLDDLAKASKEPVNHKQMRKWKPNKKEKQKEKWKK